MSELRGPLVLYVEDEPLILELGLGAMEEAGFEVESFSAAEPALAAISAHGGDVRALVTDIDLGSRLTGWDIAKTARGLHPEMPIIYVSGGSANDWPSLGVPGSIMLVKPYAAAQLVVAISNALIKADGDPAT